MAAMSTTLTHFSTNGDSRIWTTSGHTAARPRKVIQKRRVPSQLNQSVISELRVQRTTIDPDDKALASQVEYMVTVKYPQNIKSGETDVTDALATFRDIVASDEFGTMVSTQGFVKP